jgi:WD40 repeat protein
LHFAFCTGASLPAQEPTYWQDVRPLLRKHCTVCHNPRQRDEPDVSGGLVLDTYDAALRWKEKNRPLVHPGKSATSLLYQVVSTADSEKRMPLGAKPLPKESVALLARWIDSGAKEGVRPADAAVASPTSPTRRARKLAVTLPAPAAGRPLSLTLKVGPLSPVVALAFHPTEPWLATGAYGRVTVWDVKSGQPVRTLTSVLGAVNDLRFSPDGRRLAVAGGQPSAKGDLRLFSVPGWKLDAVLAGHDDVVAGVSFRPDGAKLASASYDRTLRIWNLANHKAERVLTSHSDFVTSVAWSPDGKLLTSGSKDRSVRLVDAESGASAFTFSDRNEDVLAVAYSPDGKSVVSAGLEPNLSWWSTETGARLRTVGGHSGAVHDLAFSRDGKLLASAGADGTLKLWNGSSGGLARSIPAGSLVYSVALNPDGKLVAAGCFDGMVRLFDTATGRPRATLLALPPSGEKTPWLVLTPEGYTNGSDDLLALGRWAASGRELPAPLVSKLRSPTSVVKALRGEVVPPTLGK